MGVRVARPGKSPQRDTYKSKHSCDGRNRELRVAGRDPSTTARISARLSSDAALRHPGAVKPIHHSGNIIFRPLGVLALGRSMHVRRVITLALTVRVKYDREIGHNCPGLWKQFICFAGLGTVQPVHATI